MLQNESVPKPRWVVIYARVSSKEQEVEGFSIPAQLELLRDYASKQGMKAVQEFVDVESASTSGRTRFGQMLAFLGKHRTSSRRNQVSWGSWPGIPPSSSPALKLRAARRAGSTGDESRERRISN